MITTATSSPAPRGLVFNNAGQLSVAMRAGAFVGEFGGSDWSTVNGYKLGFAPFAGGKPIGLPKDVATGYLSGDVLANGRPVGRAPIATAGGWLPMSSATRCGE